MEGAHIRGRDLLAGRNVLQGHDLHGIPGVDYGAGVGAAAVVQHGRPQVQRAHVLERDLREDLPGRERSGRRIESSLHYTHSAWAITVLVMGSQDF